MEPIFWPILLLLAAFVLIVLELFVPSGGVLSILSAACLVGAVVTGFMISVQCGVLVLAVMAVGIPLTLFGAVKWWPHTPIGRLILIERPTHPDDLLPDTLAYRGLKQLVGRRGVAKTTMMPGGIVVVGRTSFDAISQGMPIDAGQPIEVVAVRTHRLVVRPSEGPVEPDEARTDDVLSQPIDALGLEDFES
jgi:membrane-bound ClpP family serine protease